MDTFEIAAEYLHVYVGRRLVVPVDASGAGIPFEIRAVRYEPEGSRVLVHIDAPMVQPLEVEFMPDQFVRVEHLVPAVAL